MYNPFKIAIALCLLAVSVTAYGQEKVPLDAFASNPTFSGAKLSPSGEKIGFLTEKDNQTVMIALDTTSGESVLIPKFGDAELFDFFWANDEVLLLQYLLSHNQRYFGESVRETRSISYDLTNGKFEWLGAPQKEMGSNEHIMWGETVLHLLPDEPEQILMQFDEHNLGKPSVFKVNVRTGKRNRVKPGRRGIYSWFADFDGNIRYGYGSRNSTGSWVDSDEVAVIVEKNGSLTDITEMDWFKAHDDWFEYHAIEGFTENPDIIYISAPNKYDSNSIYTFNFRTGEIVDTVFEREDIGPGGFLRHPDTGNIIGVYYTADVTEYLYFDEEYAKLQRSLSAALKSQNVRISGKARHKELYLIYASTPTNPGDYYLYNRDTGQLQYIAPTHDGIYPEDMAPVKRINYKARDGQKIPAYLTLPQGRDKNLPTIILPHGGPYARDTMNWDYWAQFYANRGYAVIQPNFRGSTGYGKSFYEAGRKQWGGLMQDDVTDATYWMIENGYSDPDRICILGGSYGGYASLFAPIKEPDLYKCAVSINGVADIPMMRREDIRDFSKDNWIQDVGLEGHEPEFVSPYHRANEVNIPILLIAAVNDGRVPYDQSTRMHKKLKSLGKDSTYIEMADGDHWLMTKAAKTTMLTETEKFLEKHIGH
ncbi:alpha/beta hydrolase family protein [Kordiimonas pumila]|uniref:Alpha/beta hydrolase family protein n=1 Tax=Kordiimonas pumila TaxID=2161677 RepID=A0ABV7D6B0_9PROT|nr:S9 family peptidase [Kordiimonas pumila]